MGTGLFHPLARPGTVADECDAGALEFREGHAGRAASVDLITEVPGMSGADTCEEQEESDRHQQPCGR